MKNAILALALVSAAPLIAQITYDTAGATFTETFTNASGWGTVATNVTLSTWADNSTIPGWYAAYWANNTSTATVPVTFVQSQGVQNTSHSLYLFRDSTDATTIQDGALGAFPINSQTGNGANVGGVFYGTQIVNNTGVALDSLTLGYTLEIWRLSNNSSANSLAVSYRLGGTDLTSGTWNNVPSLASTSPAGPTSGSAAQNGNLAQNRVVVAPQLINLDTPLSIGGSIWVRWYDNNDTGVDNGIGIDDVSLTFTAIPEPSAVAGLAGLAALGLAATRRRQRA